MFTHSLLFLSLLLVHLSNSISAIVKSTPEPMVDPLYRLASGSRVLTDKGELCPDDYANGISVRCERVGPQVQFSVQSGHNWKKGIVEGSRGEWTAQVGSESIECIVGGNIVGVLRLKC
eukprot:GFKZ01014426.1.p1 GENE.GFKZ01014426.1~~GFKZ01014426.1.p1  ORF type:complete len:126 (+),score=2.13 GFKZ01014426.1:23-379(+)